jgi:hypothetical protein
MEWFECDRRPLACLLADLRMSVAQALTHTRLIAIGAPFTSEIVQTAEQELLYALSVCREAQELANRLSETIGVEGER